MVYLGSAGQGLNLSTYNIKALTAPVSRLSLNVGWENVLKGDLELFHLTLNFL